jgi:hypothetical protein
MHFRELRADVIFSLAVVLACVNLATACYARTDFDGDWNVLIVTREGACEPALRYAVKIADGTVINDGVSIATVQGRVSQRGAVRVTVRSSNQWANGSGRFIRNRGNGVWKGYGTNGACAGTWGAERRQ